LLWPNQPPNVARALASLDLDVDALRRETPVFTRRWISEVAGDLDVVLAGPHRLRLVGSGAASLYIDDVLALDNGETRELELGAGSHRCLLATFSQDGAQRSTLEWQPPGGAAFEPIPATFWSHAREAPPATARGFKRVVERGVPARAKPPANPTAQISQIALDAVRAPLAALTWIDDRTLLVATRNGAVWRLDPAQANSAVRVASGLLDPRALAVVGGRTFVLQASELTELVDANGDGVVDAQRCACAAWPAGAEGGRVATHLWRAGDALVIVLEARTTDANGGASIPAALSFAPADGSVKSVDLAQLEGLTVDLGRRPIALADGSAPRIDRGPYAGQLLGLDADAKGLRRLSIEGSGASAQGCSIDFVSPLDFDLAGAARGPGGAWFAPAARAGKANANAAVVQKLELVDAPCFDLLAVRALDGGLELEFTAPLAEGLGWEAENYSVAVSSIDAPHDSPRAVEVRAASVSEDRRTVSLALDLTGDSVIDVRIVGPLRSESDAPLLETSARCWMRSLPSDRKLALRSAPDADAPPRLSAQEVRDGWIDLFDGASLAGWHASPPSAIANWRAERGVLANTAGGADLVSDEPFENFELSFEWRVTAGARSAVLFHAREGRGEAGSDGPVLSPSFELLDDARRVEGRNPLRASGACRDMYAPRSAESAPVGVWNRARLVVRDGHVEHWLGGVRVAEYVLASDDWQRRAALARPWPGVDSSPGALALRASDRRVEFRALRLRRLESRP
jgi:cytochrome c